MAGPDTRLQPVAAERAVQMLEIVTVSKDDAEGLARTLRSTAALRGHRGVRQIVVDGSQDEEIRIRNAALVNEAANVRYEWQSPNGVSAAFNRGLQLAVGEWVWFLNGGDEVHPQADPGVLLAILERSRSEAIIFDLEFETGPGWRPPMYAIWPPLVNWIPHPATIVRRRSMVEIGGFREDFKIAMDGELWIRLFGGGARADLLAIPLAKFAPDGLSSDPQRVAMEVRKIIWEHRGLIVKRWIENGRMILAAWRGFRRLAKHGTKRLR